MNAIDIELNDIRSDGVAYYRLPDRMYLFFQLVEKDKRIIGFEWDGSRNFGLIVLKKNSDKEVKQEVQNG